MVVGIRENTNNKFLYMALLSERNNGLEYLAYLLYLGLILFMPTAAVVSVPFNNTITTTPTTHRSSSLLSLVSH